MIIFFFRYLTKYEMNLAMSESIFAGLISYLNV